MTKSSSGRMARQLAASVLAVYVIDAAVFLFGSLSHRRSLYSDRTFFEAWMVVSLIIVVWAVRRLRVRPGPFLAVVLSGAILAAAIWYPLVDPWAVPRPRFLGVAPRPSPDPVTAGRPVSWRELSFLYAADDPDLDRLADEMRAKGQPFRIERFVFWQAGIAFGFGQRELPGFYESRGYRFYRLAMAATVGPLVIAECLLDGTVKSVLLVVLAQLAFFALRRKPLFIGAAHPPGA